jgi:hypothetical protein
MAVRLLVMISIMIAELGAGIAGILSVVMDSRGGPDTGGAIALVAIIGGVLVSWLVTIAFFVRKSSRAKAARIVDDARVQAGRILAEATEKSLALCSLDGGRCGSCGNPRTGRFCPKCGKSAPATTSASAQAASAPPMVAREASLAATA